VIVCVCKGVSDREIHEVVEAKGCATVREVGRECAAGTDCGICSRSIQKLLQRRRQTQAIVSK
jgi:bacterioferritin-associated ferredoxin